jgi:predicted Zn-dependent peptidase
MKNVIFTEDDIENAKKGIISTIKSIDDEQDTEITYFLGQELTNNKISLEDYIAKIQKVTKDDIIKIAQLVKVNTVYFLKNIETSEEE